MGISSFLRRLLGGADDSDRESDDPVDHEATAAAEAATGAAAESPRPTSRPDSEVSDEYRVLRLLIEHDGVIRRSKLLERTEWSEEHLEGVLEEMVDDGQVKVVPISRETYICRPGYEPKGTAIR